MALPIVVRTATPLAEPTWLAIALLGLGLAAGALLLGVLARREAEKALRALRAAPGSSMRRTHSADEMSSSPAKMRSSNDETAEERAYERLNERLSV